MFFKRGKKIQARTDTGGTYVPFPQPQQLSGSVSALGVSSNTQKVIEAGAYAARSSLPVQHNLILSCSAQDVPTELHAHLPQPLAGVFRSAGHPGKVVCLAQQQRLQEMCCNSSTPSRRQLQPGSHQPTLIHPFLGPSFPNSSQDALQARRTGAVREDLEAEAHFSFHLHSSKKRN